MQCSFLVSYFSRSDVHPPKTKTTTGTATAVHCHKKYNDVLNPYKQNRTEQAKFYFIDMVFTPEKYRLYIIQFAQ